MGVFYLSGGARCSLSTLTFDELFAQRIHSKMPCVIARVKDIEGRVHLFEGCAAQTLGSFRLPGFFKAELDAEWTACSYIQYFSLISTAIQDRQLFHTFQLQSTESFFILHGELLVSAKKPDYSTAKKCLDKALKENPQNERALQLLGKLYFYGQGVPQNRVKAKEYFDKVLELNPDNKFVVNRLAELEQPAPLPPEEPEDVAQQLEALSLEEASGTVSEAPQETTEEQNASDAMAKSDQDSISRDKLPQTQVACAGIAENLSEKVVLSAKKPPCSCVVL